MKKVFFYLILGCVLIGFAEISAAPALKYAGYSIEKVVEARKRRSQSRNQDEPARLLHPYLGYVFDHTNHPEYFRTLYSGGVSKFGFVDSTGDGVNPVMKRSDALLIVGILGGSVAQGASSYLKEALAKKIVSVAGLEHKQVILLNFAMGGYKQPQQLMAVNYLLSLGAEFDLLINIDGFNEVALPDTESKPQQVSPFYPRSWYFLVAEHDIRFLPDFVPYKAVAYGRKVVAQAVSIIPLSEKSYAINAAWAAFDRLMGITERGLRGFLASRRPHGFYAAGPPFEYSKGDEFLYEELSWVWARSSFLLDQISRENHIAYFHFLQPNQYDEGSRALTEEEKKTAFSEEHPYRKGVQKGYSYLRQRIRFLQEKGVHVYDFSMIFKDVNQSVYLDTCCHFNVWGYEYFAEKIAGVIVERLSRFRDNRPTQIQ